MENECRFMVSSSNGLMHMCVVDVCEGNKDTCPVITQGKQFNCTALVTNVSEMAKASIELSKDITKIAKKIHIEKVKIKKLIDIYQNWKDYQKKLKTAPYITDEEQEDLELAEPMISISEHLLSHEIGNLKELIIEMSKAINQ